MAASIPEPRPNIGSMIADKMAERGVKAPELARALGIREPATIRKWTKQVAPSIQSRFRSGVADFLGLTEPEFSELLGKSTTGKKVVALFSGSIPVAVRSRSIPPDKHAQEVRQLVAKSIAARIGTGQPLSAAEIQHHERLLQFVEAND